MKTDRLKTILLYFDQQLHLTKGSLNIMQDAEFQLNSPPNNPDTSLI